MSVKDTRLGIKTVTAKWFSVGYTPSFRYCPTCEKQIGWKSIEEKCCNYCGQKLK